MLLAVSLSALAEVPQFRNSLFAKFTEYGHRILHNVVGSLRLP